jgi:preprotein translocase subunit YajC
MYYLAEGAAAAPATGGNWGTTLIMIVIMFAIFYFLLIRPQQKRQKQRSAMLNELRKGDKIVTIGGIHGTILEITDDVVVLKVNDNNKLTFERSAIGSVTPREDREESKNVAADDDTDNG